MVDDDNRADGDLVPDEGDAASLDQFGARRSTWSPPPSSTDGDVSDTSDDDLARALEEDFERVTHTGVVNVLDVDAALPASPPPSAVEESRVPTDGESVQPPVRRSMPTSELAASLAQRAESGDDPAGIMAQLEEQLRLREQDAQEFQRWQESVTHSGTPLSSAEVQSARHDLEDILGSGTPSPTMAPVAAVPLPPSEPTHVFRHDDVHDDALLMAPPPTMAPISDVPPPPGHIISAMSAPAVPAAEASGQPAIVEQPEVSLLPEFVQPPEIVQPPESIQPPPPPIPDLVEPAEVRPAADPLDFDSIIGSAPAAVDAESQVFAMEDEASVNADSVFDADIADTDRAFADLMGPFPVTSDGVAILPETPVAPMEPVASSQVSTSGPPVETPRHASPRAFKVEESSVEPTALEQRVGRASRLFWLWFAANSSVVSIAFGAAVLALGMSLRQAIVATLIGVAVSFLPLGLGTLAGKWSGQPTMIVSRATFGHIGNVVPAILALIVRVFWGAVLLWFLAAGTARILKGADLTGPLSETQVMIIGLAVGFLLALVIAFFGYGLIARVQMVFTVISVLLIIGLIVITWHAVDITTALTVGDGPWILVLTGAVLVFSFVGLVWAVSSADLARYQRVSGSGASSMLWSTFGATIPAFVLIAYGAVLAASNPKVAAGLIHTPLDTVALLIPVWYPAPLIAALAFSLLSGVVVSIYSGGFALQATGAPIRRPAGAAIVGAAVAAVAVLIALSVGDFTLLLRDVATSLAVPIAAWAGIFGAEMMIRSKRFDSPSLVKRGGTYPDVRWVNLVMLIVASAIGFGLTTASVGWLGWQGYFFTLAGVPLSSDLAGSDLGVFVALVIGILTPILAGIPAIRRQEQPRQMTPATATN